MKDFTGKTALITGGNGGIGLGLAQGLGVAGADVAIWGRNAEKNESALSVLRSQGVTANSYVVDVSDETSTATAFSQTLEDMEKVDIVIANAGVPGDGSPIHKTSLEEWHRVLGVDLDGVFLTFRHAVDHLINRGEGGSLVAVASTAAVHGAANNIPYGVAKTGLLGLVRGLAVEVARHGIRVNALSPGWTKTEMTEHGYGWDKFREATTARTPVRRWGEPDDMVPAAIFLSDPDATYHTGQNIVVDGGYTVF